jgi:hypothetical protein
MSAFTDRLYDQWRRSYGGGGVLVTTGRPALPGRFSAPQKAKTPRNAGVGSSVLNSNEKDSNHGISKL